MDKRNTWNKFERGDVVRLRTTGTDTCHATIDDFSEDHMIIWVRMEGLNERKIVLYDDEGVGLLPANVH